MYARLNTLEGMGLPFLPVESVAVIRNETISHFFHVKDNTTYQSSDEIKELLSIKAAAIRGGRGDKKTKDKKLRSLQKRIDTTVHGKVRKLGYEITFPPYPKYPEGKTVKCFSRSTLKRKALSWVRKRETEAFCNP